MGVVTCAIDGLYDIICRDPDTAAGGLTPGDTDLHASGFFRHDREPLERLESEAIDRKVQIVYDGTDEWHPLSPGGAGGPMMRTFRVVIRVGYAVGDHEFRSYPIIGDDEQQIVEAIMNQSNWPVCASGCLNGYVPAESAIAYPDEIRRILEIAVLVQVTG